MLTEVRTNSSITNLQVTALQAFEMLDPSCIYDCRAAADDEPPAADEAAQAAGEQHHLWKGDVNSASIATWGLEA